MQTTKQAQVSTQVRASAKSFARPKLFALHIASLALIAVLLACLASGAPAYAAASNGYAQSGAITVSHTQVPNSDQTNFPVLVSGTFPALATSSNGGLVTSPNGYDIIFTSDAAGNNKLNFERSSYSSNGQVSFYVQVPLVSHTTDTVFYVFYGNSAVTTDQSNKAGTWDSNYVGVWHMSDNASNPTVADSTSHANNGTANATTNTKSTTGKLGTALSFNGSTDGVTTLATSGKTFTWEAWVNSGSITSSNYQSVMNMDGASYMLMDLQAGSGSFWTADSLGGNNLGISGLANNTWYHVVFVRSGDSSATGYAAYINGTLKGQAPSGSWSGTSNVTLGQRLDYPGQDLSGQLDEVRVSNIARSSDWIAAEYNNESNPSSFASVAFNQNGGGAATSAPVAPAAPTVPSASSSSNGTATTPSPNGYAQSGAITVSHTQVPNSDQTNFPVLVSGTFPALATSSNGGLVTSPNGYDIIFTSDAAGNNKLNFERSSYSSNGQVSFYVQVPLVSHTTDTVFYVFYGNSAVTTDQSNKAGTWDSNYVGVWHMSDNASNPTVADSTSHANNGTANATTNTKSTTGKLGTALSFNGSTDGVTTLATSGKTFTWEAWVNSGSITSSNYQSVMNMDGASYMLMDLQAGSGSFWTADSLGGNNLGISGLANNTWYHVVFVRSGDSSATGYAAYINGTLKGQAPSGSWSGTSNVTLGQRLDYPGQDLSGQLDEVRVSNIARSSDWIAAEYNNESNPSSFASVAFNQNGGGAATQTLPATTVPTVTLSSTLIPGSTSISFGSVNVNSLSSKTVILTNSGTASVTISQLGISGLGLSATGIATPFTLSAGQSTTLTLLFAPANSGAINGTASIVSNASNTTLAIAITGTGVQPQISVSPSSFNFGNVNMGSVSLHSFTLTNTGSSSLTISQASISGSSYGVTGLSLPVTMAPGQSSSFVVQFTPSTSGSLSGSVTLTSNSPNPATVLLSGSGVAPTVYSVLLSWNANTTSVEGYNVYSSIVAGGPYTKVTATPVTSPSYTISNVQQGQTYYFVVTAVSASGVESNYSTQVSVIVP